MQVEVVHPRAFPALFGLSTVPSKMTLYKWRKQHGFPSSLTVPKGHYPLAAVRSWFAARNAEAVS
jgi:hypothetical protein